MYESFAYGIIPGKYSSYYLTLQPLFICCRQSKNRVLCNNHIQLSKMSDSTKTGESRQLCFVIQVYIVRRPILNYPRHSMHALRLPTRQG